MARAFLGMGSNLGDRWEHLRAAVASLDEVVAVSEVFETAPIGGPDQGAFLNLVVELDTNRTPHELLAVSHRLESAAGRVRQERWGPRTLDVDVLWVEGVTVAEPDLIVPHPRMFERRFVIEPLAQLAPELCPEDWRRTLDGQVTPVGRLSGTEPAT